LREGKGPLLLMVDPALRTPGLQSYKGKVTFDPTPAQHSVAVIGHRKVDPAEESSKTSDIFLVQNSWASKQYFEASREYLVSCNGRLTRLKDPVQVREDWLTSLMSAESADCFDGAEGEEALEG
jgi:hypothetical protein